jgi:hypothetical protein
VVHQTCWHAELKWHLRVLNLATNFQALDLRELNCGAGRGFPNLDFTSCGYTSRQRAKQRRPQSSCRTVEVRTPGQTEDRRGPWPATGGGKQTSSIQRFSSTLAFSALRAKLAILFRALGSLKMTRQNGMIALQLVRECQGRNCNAQRQIFRSDLLTPCALERS